MEGSSLLSSLSSPSSAATHTNFKPQFNLSLQRPSLHSSSSSMFIPQFLSKTNNSAPQNSASAFSPRTSLRSSAVALDQALGKPDDSLSTVSAREMLSKIDKSGRFCSPRAARELALYIFIPSSILKYSCAFPKLHAVVKQEFLVYRSIIYAACLEGSDPVRLFEKRMNARREVGYDFDEEKLLEYNHMSFAGPPITVESVEEANELLRQNEKESDIGKNS